MVPLFSTSCYLVQWAYFYNFSVLSHSSHYCLTIRHTISSPFAALFWFKSSIPYFNGDTPICSVEMLYAICPRLQEDYFFASPSIRFQHLWLVLIWYMPSLTPKFTDERMKIPQIWLAVNEVLCELRITACCNLMAWDFLSQSSL